jgi:hypothetical protein
MTGPPGLRLGEPECRDPPGDPEGVPAGSDKYIVALHFGDGHLTEGEDELATFGLKGRGALA